MLSLQSHTNHNQVVQETLISSLLNSNVGHHLMHSPYFELLLHITLVPFSSGSGNRWGWREVGGGAAGSLAVSLTHPQTLR